MAWQKIGCQMISARLRVRKHTEMGMNARRDLYALRVSFEDPGPDGDFALSRRHPRPLGEAQIALTPGERKDNYPRRTPRKHEVCADARRKKRHWSAEDAEERGELQGRKRQIGKNEEGRADSVKYATAKDREFALPAIFALSGNTTRPAGIKARASSANNETSWLASPCWTAQSRKRQT